MKKLGTGIFLLVLSSGLASNAHAFGSAPAQAAPAQASRVTPVSTVNPIPLPIYFAPRLGAIHVTMLWTSFGTPSTNASAELIHHDGDPLAMSMSTSAASVQTSVVFKADPNSAGSPPKTYAFSGPNGSYSSSYTCTSVAYCDIGLLSDTEAAAGSQYSSTAGVSAGNYTLTVTYGDGTYAVHSLALGGYGSATNFGEILLLPGSSVSF